MASWSRILLHLLACGAALAAPAADKRQGPAESCTNPSIRRAWHTLEDTQKQAYLDAEVCLMKQPATLGLRGAKTKYDELQSLHILQADVIHFTATFLPFHRVFMWAHEVLLRTLCGFAGPLPYWEETIDSGNFSGAAIFSAELGFGSDGAGASGCIPDGPFASYVNPLGPGYNITDHCISRAIDDGYSYLASAAMVSECMNETIWVNFWQCVEDAPHVAGHGGVGAEMANVISSPGDPLLYMHHTWLDKIWAKWQEEDPSRLTEITGNNLPAQPLAERPPDVPEPVVVGDPGYDTTLTHVIYTYGVIPNVTVGDIMNTKGGVLCYDYD